MSARLSNREIVAWLARVVAEIGIISVALLPLAMIALALVADAALAERTRRIQAHPTTACRLTGNEAHCLARENGEWQSLTFHRSTPR